METEVDRRKNIRFAYIINSKIKIDWIRELYAYISIAEVFLTKTITIDISFVVY